MVLKSIILTIVCIVSTGCASKFALIEEDSTFVVSGESREKITMASIDENDTVRSVDGDSDLKGTVKYLSKQINWPTATVKEVSFTKNGGGVLYPITDETTIYVLKGSIKATVSGKTTVLNAGDVASYPEGALRDIEKPTDATVIAWTAPSLETGAQPAVVKRKSSKEVIVANGLLKVRRYSFPGNSVRAVQLEKGLTTRPGVAKTDSLIYLIEGALNFHQDGQVFSVKGGDFIREVAGSSHFWEVTETSTFVTTSGLPLGAAPIDPDDATDTPK